MICEATKLCGGKNGCGRTLPVSEFRYHRNGFYTVCRTCDNACSVERTRLNPKLKRAVVLKSKKKCKINNPVAAKARQLVDNVKTNYGLTDIDIHWVMDRLERGTCELTGVPFVYETRHPFMPSIDRIDRTQPGHMRDNCRMILWGLNAFKGAASEKVFLESLEKVGAAFVQG